MTGNDELDQLLSGSLLPPSQLIPELARFIVGGDADRALTGLAESVIVHQASLSDPIRHHLQSFLSSVLETRRQISPGLAALLQSLCKVKALPALLPGLSLLSCEPTLRISLLSSLYSALPDRVSSQQLLSFSSFIDGETDPPALLAALSLVSLALARSETPLSLDTAESVFDQCCVYFPITYMGPACDGDRLRSELINCLTSRPEMATFALPFFLEKLNSSLTQAKVQSLVALRQCISSFSSSSVEPYLTEISTCLIQTWEDSLDAPSTIDVSIETLKGVLARFFIGESNRHYKLFLEPILVSIRDILAISARSQNASVCTRVLGALCSVSSASVGYAFQCIWPMIADHISSGNDQAERIALLHVVGVAFVDTIAAPQSGTVASVVMPCTNLSLSPELIASSIDTMSKVVPVLPSDSTVLTDLIDVTSSVISRSASRGDVDEDRIIPANVVTSALNCLISISNKFVDLVVQATFPSIVCDPEQLEYMCIRSATYFSEVLPSLARMNDGSLSNSLCKIVARCSSDNYHSVVTELALPIDADGDADLFRAIYNRTEPEQQSILCSKHVLTDSLTSRVAIACVLGRHWQTPLPNQWGILKTALESGIAGDETSALIVADILNKASDDVLTSFINLSSFQAVDWSSTNSSSLLIWTCKALASRGASYGFEMASKLCSFPIHFDQIPLLLDSGASDICWWRILPLYPQRMLCTMLPQLLPNTAYCSYLPALLQHAPRRVMLDYMRDLLPPFERCLTTSAAPITLSLLLILIEADPSCIIGRGSNLVVNSIMLTRAPNTTRTRLQALGMLQLLVRHMAKDELYPYSFSIRKALGSSLDDNKRVCRQLARESMRLM